MASTKIAYINWKGLLLSTGSGQFLLGNKRACIIWYVLQPCPKRRPEEEEEGTRKSGRRVAVLRPNKKAIVRWAPSSLLLALFTNMQFLLPLLLLCLLLLPSKRCWCNYTTQKFRQHTENMMVGSCVSYTILFAMLLAQKSLFYKRNVFKTQKEESKTVQQNNLFMLAIP